MTERAGDRASRYGLGLGRQVVWWCPNCGGTLRKPPFKQGGDRYHSWKCQVPMRRVTVTVDEEVLCEDVCLDKCIGACGV